MPDTIQPPTPAARPTAPTTPTTPTLRLVAAVEAALSRPAPARHEPDPDTVCLFCEGRGFVRWYTPDHGWSCRPCVVCEGDATAGAFVVVLYAPRWRTELKGVYHDLATAVRRADGAARRLARSPLGVVRAEVEFRPAARGERPVTAHVARVGAPG